MLTSRPVSDGYSFRLDADSSSTYSDSSSSVYKQRIDSLFRPAAAAASSSYSDYEPVEAPPERKPPPPPPPPPPPRPLPPRPATAALWVPPGGAAGGQAGPVPTAAGAAPLWRAPARDPPGPGAVAGAVVPAAGGGAHPLRHGAEFSVEYLGAVQVADGATRLEELQQPLKRLYLPRLRRRRARPLQDSLQITDTGVRVCFGRGQELFNPFTTVAVWAAVKFVASRGGGGRQRFGFLPLICDPESPERGRLLEDSDGSLPDDAPAARHPPLLACVMRRPGTLGALECHGFVCAAAEDAIVIAANLYQALLLRMQPDGGGGSGGSSGGRRGPAAARSGDAAAIVSGSAGSGSEDALGPPRRPRRRRAPPPPPGPPRRDDATHRSDRRSSRPLSADLTGLDRHHSSGRNRDHSRDHSREQNRDHIRDQSRDSIRSRDFSRNSKRDSIRRQDLDRDHRTESVRRREFQRSSSRESLRRREFQRSSSRESLRRRETSPDRSRESVRRRQFHRSASRDSVRSRTFSRDDSRESVRGRLRDAPSDGSLRRRAGSVGAVPGLVAAAAAAAAARQQEEPAAGGGARSGRRLARSSSDPSRSAVVLASAAERGRPPPDGRAPLAPDPAVDLGQLLAQLQQRDGIRTVDDVLRRVIAPGGMSFSELRPEHRELLLRLAVTLSRDEMYQRSKSIMKKQTRKGSLFNSESDNTTSDGSSTISNVLKATKKSLSRLSWRAGGFQSPSAYLKQHTPLAKFYNARANAKQKDAKNLSDEFPAKISGPASADSETATSRQDCDSSQRRGKRRSPSSSGRRRSPTRCDCERDAAPARFGSMRDKGAHLPPSRSLLELPLACDADSCSGSERCYCSLQRGDSAAHSGESDTARRRSAADLLSEHASLQQRQAVSAEDSSGASSGRRCHRRRGSRGTPLHRADSVDTGIDLAADDDGGGGGRFLVVSAADEAGRVLRRGGSQRRRKEDVLTLKKSTEIAATFSGLRLSQTTDLLSSGSDGEPAGHRAARHGYSEQNIEDSLGYLP